MDTLSNRIKLTDDLERNLIAQEINQRFGFSSDAHLTSTRGSRADLIVAAMLAAVSPLAYLLAR